MIEYFIYEMSCAAPFVSDVQSRYIEAASPEDALSEARKTYSHPCGLFSAACYKSADDFHRGYKPIAAWLRDKD